MIMIACIAGACLIWFVVGKVRHGSSCCGEREGPKKRVQSGDRNPKHYPYHYSLRIDGMVCGNCVRNVENAFNSVDGIYAKVDLASKTAKVYAKQPISDEEVINILKSTSYTLIELTEIKF